MAPTTSTMSPRSLSVSWKSQCRAPAMVWNRGLRSRFYCFHAALQVVSTRSPNAIEPFM